MVSKLKEKMEKAKEDTEVRKKEQQEKESLHQKIKALADQLKTTSSDFQVRTESGKKGFALLRKNPGRSWSKLKMARIGR